MVKLQAFSEREGLSHLVKTMEMDIDLKKKMPLVAKSKLLETIEACDLLHVARFMDKELMKVISAHLKQEAFLVIHHFHDGAFSNASKKKMDEAKTITLKELENEFFSADLFEIMVSETVCLPNEENREFVNFVARKKKPLTPA